MNTQAMAQNKPADADNFYISDKVTVQKVTFPNQYKMNITGNLYMPKGIGQNKKHAAIIVGHPMGAVKEQSANLYATKMAEYGFVTLSVDLSFWGESEGEPRSAVVPDIYVETFSAAVDFLGTRPFVDREKIGVIGICGSGGFALGAAKIDPRLKAIATIAIYDMGEATRTGINNSFSLEDRKQMLREAAEQRYVEFAGGEVKWLSYLPVEIGEDADAVTRSFHSFYRTERGRHIPAGRTLELTQNRALTQEVKFVNFYPFNDMEIISPRPLLFITGDQSHSKEFSEDAYKRATEPKELYYVKGADHVDLYDRVKLIPFGKLNNFFTKSLK